MKIQSQILAVEREPDGLLIQFAGGGIRGAVRLEATREIPLVGQTLTFEYAMPGAAAGDPLVGLIPPRATSASSSGTTSNSVTSNNSGVNSSTGGSATSRSASAGSDALLAFMTGGRNIPLTDRDIEAELDAFVGTREEVQRGLAIQRRR